MSHFFTYQNTISIKQHRPSRAVRGKCSKNMDVVNKLKARVIVIQHYKNQIRIYYHDRKLAKTYFLKKNYNLPSYLHKNALHCEDHLPFIKFFEQHSKPYTSTLKKVQEFKSNPCFNGYSLNDYYSKNPDISNYKVFRYNPPRNKFPNCNSKLKNCHSLADLDTTAMVFDLFIYSKPYRDNYY